MSTGNSSLHRGSRAYPRVILAGKALDAVAKPTQQPHRLSGRNCEQGTSYNCHTGYTLQREEEELASTLVTLAACMQESLLFSIRWPATMFDSVASAVARAESVRDGAIT